MTGGINFPALELWWDELRAGKRTRTTFDPLWAAACEEMNAKEWLETGHTHELKLGYVAMELSVFVPLDEMTDDEFSDILGPSWAELTGRRVEDLEIEWSTDGQGGDHAA